MKQGPVRLDSIEAYRKRRGERLASRMDDDDEGRWVTTEHKHKVHINEEGVPDKGNQHVLQKMSDGRESNPDREEFAKVKKELDDLEAAWKKEDDESFSRRSKQKDYFEGRRAKDFTKRFKEAKQYYNGESLEEVKKKLETLGANLSTDEDFDRYSAFMYMQGVMETFGEDSMKKEVYELYNDTYDYESARKEKRAEMVNRLSKIADKAYPKLSDCDSAIALEAKLKSCKLFVSSKNTMDEVSMGTMDDQTAKQVGGAVQNVFDKFPALKRQLAVFSVVDDEDVSHYGISNDKLVSLNGFYFNNREALEQNLKRDVKENFHPVGTDTVAGIVTHEYGHQLDYFFSKKFTSTLSGRRFSDYVLEKVSKNLGKETATCQTELSKYATRNGKEFLAEAFAEYMCSPEPRDIAVEVGKIVEEFIGRL